MFFPCIYNLFYKYFKSGVPVELSVLRFIFTISHFSISPESGDDHIGSLYVEMILMELGEGLLFGRISLYFDFWNFLIFSSKPKFRTPWASHNKSEWGRGGCFVVGGKYLMGDTCAILRPGLKAIRFE